MASCLMRELWILLAKNILHKIHTFLYTFFEIIAPLMYAALVYKILKNRNPVTHAPSSSINFGDLTTYKRSYILGYAPANEITDELMFRAARLANHKYQAQLEAIGFASEYQMMNFVNNRSTNFHSVYAFDHMTSHTKQPPKQLHLVLRPIIDSNSWMKTIAKEYKYDLHIMQVIMESYIYQLTGQEQEINVTWSNKPKLTILRQIKPRSVETISVIYYIMMGFLISRNVYCIAHERECGVTKLLSRTGINMYMYWLSWFISVFVVFWLASLVAGTMMFVETDNFPPAFVKSDIYAVLLYFTLVAATSTCYCIMGSHICKKAHTACTITTCFYLGSAFPLQNVRLETLANAFACVLMNKNVHMTLLYIDSLERTGREFTFSSADKILFPYISICICGLVYVGIARILHHCVVNDRPIWTILPGWENQHQKAHRPSTRDICGTTVTSDSDATELKPGVVINKMCASIPAPLEDITLTIYENNVTVIADLDGNSSTTFLSILTGETRPLGGSVVIQELDIVKNVAEINKMTSLCPKDQAVITSFTVLENLIFFHQIKGASQGNYKRTRLLEVIDMFELSNKCLNTPIVNLSAAERRLVQIAVVYLSNSKLLLFDYPTVDMDPYTKSKCWNVIRRNIEDKVVIVCTESIEEAEMVGDMIAVVSGGLVRSYGSIDHIYRIYGIGYNLLIDKETNFDLDRVTMIVKGLVPNASVVDETDKRVVFLLPMKSASIFYHLLTFLENHKRTLGIARFSMNTVSLEEAILKKSTEVALNEMNDKPSVELTCANPKKFEMYLTSLPQSASSIESDVDRLEPKPSILEIIKASSKANTQMVSNKASPLAKYTGYRLMLSQAEALFNKRIILSVCAFHLEAVQVMILLTLAASLYSEDLLWSTKETDLNPKLVNNTIARLVSTDQPNTVSWQLAQRYKEVLRRTNIHFEKEYTSEQALFSESTHDTLKRYNMIGASFHLDNVSNVYQSVAFHSTCGTGDEDLLLPVAITEIMNAYLYYFKGDKRYYMYASKLAERYSEKDFNDSMRSIGRTVKLHRHHSSFLQSVSLLMVPYFAVSERMSGFKHLQHLSGAGSVLYWTVTLISDLTTYIFLVLIYPLIGVLLKSAPLYDYMEVVTLSCGVVMLLYIYVLQLAFSVPSSAAFIICLLNYFLGDIATIMGVIFSKKGQLLQNKIDSRLCLAIPPCILPSYILSSSENTRHYKLCQMNSGNCHAVDNEIKKHCCKLTCVDDKCTVIRYDVAEKKLDLDTEIIVAIACHLVFWSVLLLLIENKFFEPVRLVAQGYWNSLRHIICGKSPLQRKSSLKRKTFNIQSLFSRRRSEQKVQSQLLWIDPGISEHLRLLQTTPNEVGLIRLVGVEYKDTGAMGHARLNFMIKKGESYCFIDTEKSTASQILKLLSGRTEPVRGKIIVKGELFRVRGKPSYTPIGYCKEENSVIEALTGREVLTIHAKLRGITDDDINMVVDSVLSAFNLLDKADLRSGNYSSSDLWLLNIAVALIGDPEIILLDDPFGNLDVVNKSLVWKALDKSMLSGCTVIMCSDKIREVSDKVTVVAILLNGEPVCIGSPESVRNRYCSSYTLLAKLDVCNRNLPIETLITSLKERFPKCVIFYDHQDFLHMRVPYDDTTLPDVFALMESAKKHLKIQSYKLVHTNLAYVITAIQQRVVEESTAVSEMDDGDDEED